MSTTHATRQHILDTVAELFHTQSYSAVGVATICNQAGVSKGSFFHFFKSKQDLAVAVLDQFMDEVGEVLVSKAFASKYSPLERLDQFIDRLYKLRKSETRKYGHLPGCPFGNMAVEQSTQDEVICKKADYCLMALKDRLKVTILEAVETGELPAVDADATADAMLSYIEGIQLLAKSRNNPELIHQLGPAIKTIQVVNTT